VSSRGSTPGQEGEGCADEEDIDVEGVEEAKEERG